MPAQSLWRDEEGGGNGKKRGENKEAPPSESLFLAREKSSGPCPLSHEAKMARNSNLVGSYCKVA